MINLWLVILMMGNVSGTIGPLPYGRIQCEANAANMQTDLDLKIAATIAEGKALPEGAASIRFLCVESETRPEHGKPLP